MVDISRAEHFLVVDLECTTDEEKKGIQRSVPRLEMESIEIGAVLVDKHFKVLKEYTKFIKPVRHPILTEFCTQLTHIDQSMISSADHFPDVFKNFQDEMIRVNTIFCSWGDFDRKQLEQDCLYWQISYAMPNHINLKKMFSITQHKTHEYGLSKALRISKLQFEGTPHRGIDDAKNIVKLLPLILNKQRIFKK